VSFLRGGRYDGKGKLFRVIFHTKKTGWGCHPFVVGCIAEAV